eukprot:scaffold109054_cov63-Phaeocystis_antarctica.AAC.4
MKHEYIFDSQLIAPDQKCCRVSQTPQRPPAHPDSSTRPCLAPGSGRNLRLRTSRRRIPLGTMPGTGQEADGHARGIAKTHEIPHRRAPPGR